MRGQGARLFRRKTNLVRKVDVDQQGKIGFEAAARGAIRIADI